MTESSDSPLVAEPAQAGRGEGLVLVVDDVAAIRKLTSRILEGVGFETCTAADGGEALKIFAKREDEIVAVLLDLTMPGMGGEETLRQLREMRQGVPVLVMSGLIDEQIVGRLVGEPGTAMLHKPFTKRALINTIQGLIEGTAGTPQRAV